MKKQTPPKADAIDSPAEPSPSTDEFGARLDLFIKEVYGSRVKFTEETGLSKQQLSDYTNGKKEPKFPQLVRIFSAGMSIDWGFSGRGSMTWRAEAPTIPFNDGDLDSWANEIIVLGESIVRLGREAKERKGRHGTAKENRQVGK